MRFFTDYQDHIKCHQLFKKLREGLVPPFDYEEYRQRKEREKIIETSDLNQLVDEIVGMIPSSSPDEISLGNLSRHQSLISEQ